MKLYKGPFDEIAEHEVERIFRRVTKNWCSPPNDPDPLARFTDRERTVILIQYFDMEVHDGGLCQFLSSPMGDYAKETVRRLEAIGARESASVLARAITVVQDQSSDSLSQKRIELLERLSSEYRGREEDVFRLLLDYWEKSVAEDGV